MSDYGSPIEAIKVLLDLAREFEKEEKHQSALDTYKRILAQLPADSPLKKEIEILVAHLEDRSKITIPNSDNPTRKWWIFSASFLVASLLIGAIIIVNKKLNLSPIVAEVTNQTNTLAQVTSSDATRAPQTSDITQTNNSYTQSKIFLVIKSDTVSLRAGPHIYHPETSKMYQKGTQMEVLGRYNTDWFYVKSPDGEKGWLIIDWVTIEKSLVNEIIEITQIPTPPSKPLPKRTPHSYP